MQQSPMMAVPVVVALSVKKFRGVDAYPYYEPFSTSQTESEIN
jgi:hypothetical protein